MLADGAVPRSTRPAAGGSLPAAAPPAASPLDEAQYALVQEAARDYKAIKKVSRIALGSSVTTLAIGVLAAPFTVFWPSFAAAFITVGLLVIGIVEFMGYRKLLLADPSAARWLARNQLAFLGLITIYCGIQMLTFSTEDLKREAMSAEFRAQLSAMPEMAADVDRTIEKYGPIATYGFYSLVIVLSVFFQGGLALYYYTRHKLLDAFQLRPPWVRRLLVECSPESAR